MKRTYCNSDQHRRGIVLLVVLVAIIVGVATLVSLARVSMRAGVDASHARDNLQARWGSTSLRRAMLPAAPNVFEARDKALRTAAQPHPPAILPGQVVLGGVPFDFLLADEDSKANVNGLFLFGGKEKTRLAVRELSGMLTGVQLQPESVPPGQGSELAIEDGQEIDQLHSAFRAWGQVFDMSRMNNLPQTTRRLTCWGNEAINIRRAEEETAIETIAVVLPKSRARTLVTEYKKNQANLIALYIDRYASKPADRAQLNRLLSERSVCYSLYVGCRSPNGNRSSFAVITPDKEGVLRSREFEYRGQ